MNSHINVSMRVAAVSLILLSNGLRLAAAEHERVHSQAGFAISVPAEWKARQTLLGLRLARKDAVINVVLHARKEASQERFFKTLETPLPESKRPGLPRKDLPRLRRHSTGTLNLLEEPALFVEYLTGTTDNGHRSFVTYAVHDGRGFVISLDCSAKGRTALYEDFEDVAGSFRITPISLQPIPSSASGSSVVNRADSPTARNELSPSDRAVRTVSAPVEDLSDDEVQVMLEASGVSKVKRDPPDGDETLFKMRVGERTFGIINDRAHGQLRCYAFFGSGGEGVTERRLRTVNAWNSDNRFAKAFVYDNGSWVLESDLRYGQGARPEAVMSHVARFAELIPRFVKHVEELMAAN